MTSEYYTTKACKLPDYLELVDFYRKPDYEQIKYLVFFVTEIAGLRSDMTAKVIAQRLVNQEKGLSLWLRRYPHAVA